MKAKSEKYDLLVIIVATLMILFVVDYFFISLAVVNGGSMYPTIQHGDKLIYKKAPYLYKNFTRGDIIIFKPPQETKKESLFIKRIIATTKDTYIIENGALCVNGIDIRETYICDGEYLNKDYPYTKGIVPDNRVFVLGDNRNNSNDSRRFSCVKKEEVVGKVILRIWPLNKISFFKNPFGG